MTARRLLMLALPVILAATACGNGAGGGETDSPAPVETITVTETVTSQPTAEATSGDDGGSDAAPYEPCADAALAEQAFVFVTTPRPGEVVSGTISVEGCSNTFEANVMWRLADRDGQTLAEGNTTASCGTGCVGDFQIDVEVPGSASGIVTLEVFDRSAEDGSVEFLNAIPLRVQP